MSFRTQMRYMNPYDIHKAIINEYVLKKPGDAAKLLQRNTSKDKTVFDVLKQNHRFIWDDSTPDSWEEQFAKKYYDKLFKEYCIGDLSKYKQNKIALRWRTENEVVAGKGQFTCGNKPCSVEACLKSWEVNFAYSEDDIKKNALVKIRLCPDCSKKLNYFSKKREVKRLNKRKKRGGAFEASNYRKIANDGADDGEAGPSDSQLANSTVAASIEVSSQEDGRMNKMNPWENIKPAEIKSRDDEMEEYLQDLLL